MLTKDKAKKRLLNINTLNTQHLSSVLALKQLAVEQKGTAYYHPKKQIIKNSLHSGFSLGLFTTTDRLEGFLTTLPQSCHTDLEALLPDFTHSAYISGLYVNLQYRQRGYANNMFQTLESLLANSTVDLCWTTIDPSNQASVNTFKKQGFKILSMIAAYETKLKRYLAYKYT
ncbi:N-acetyltransferase [uncultured Shewanella sp.]|uniref:GNAT family N-acetyltransferase n=1 Tax=uncultured Shewanella sp. TaxID=173975 RepID=UPI00261F5EDA|nr:GNAT family N-acetyltransferase [uncultured Shewanella sp.]